MNNKERLRWIKSQSKFATWRQQQSAKWATQCDDPYISYDATAELISFYLTKGKLLDVGCGSGGLKKSKAFPKGIYYVGLDPLRIENFNYDFPYEEIPAEDCMNKFKKNFFDVIVIKDSVNYAINIVEMFKSIKFVLKPKGYLIISENGRDQITTKNCFRRIIRNFISPIISVEQTYPNGYIDNKKILRALDENHLSVVKNEILDGRLNIVARKI